MSHKTKQQRRIYSVLIIAFFVLLVLGMVNVFSSTFVEDRVSGNTYAHLFRQIIMVAIGMIPAWFLFKKDYHFLNRHLKLICAVTFIVVLLVPFIGIHVNGARRWIGFGFASFQPSELAKLVGILYTTSCISSMLKNQKPIHIFHRISDKRRDPAWKHIHVIPDVSLWLPLIFAGLVAIQPDMGTAIVIIAIPFFMILISGARISDAKIPILLVLGLVAAYTISAPYRLNRIVSWLDPWSYEKTLGYQTVQGLIAIGSGGITGQGLGTGVSKFSYLPEAHTDFAFAVFAQEWGLIGSVVMVALFAAIVYYGISCARNTHDPYGMFLALGITLYLGGQGFINIGMVSGVLPVVGVPLPFISYGGTSLIVNMIAAGLLLNIAKRNYRSERMKDMAGEEVQPSSMKAETRSRFTI